MDTILALPGMVVSIAITLAGVFALLGPHGGPPPGATGVLTPAAELASLLRPSGPVVSLLERADPAHRKATPYGSMAMRRLLTR